MFVDYILQWARDKGYAAVYGSPEQVNEMLTSVPFEDSNDGTAVIMHLVSDSETYNGHDRAIVAVYFASLCPFDFNGESLLPEQERLKNIGKALLLDIRSGNSIAYEYPRWQYGYDDYAENVAWCCLRVTITALAADCVPMPGPPTPAAVSVPKAAFEWLLSQGKQPTLRTFCASEQTEGRPVEVGTSYAIVTDEDAGVLPFSATVGTETTQADVSPVEIDSGVVAQMPSLAGMEGKWLYIFGGSAQLWDSGEVCASASLGDIWQGGDDCWEVEVPELDVLNFYVPFGGTIRLYRTGAANITEFEYSTDGGRTWQIWEEVDRGRTIELPVNGRIWVRNTSETAVNLGQNTARYYQIFFNTYAYIYGDIRSIHCKNPNIVNTIAYYSFYRMFEGKTGYFEPAAYDLKIKGSTVNTCGLFRAFYNTQLASVVIYPETILSKGLDKAFYNCITLRKVVTYMKTIEADSLNDWLYGVNPTGDIYCDSSLTLPTGASGIPSGWTRHDLSELE